MTPKSSSQERRLKLASKKRHAEYGIDFLPSFSSTSFRPLQDILKNGCAICSKTPVIQGDHDVDRHRSYCDHLAMSRAKQQIIEATGGFFMSDIGDGFNGRQRELTALKKKLLSGASLDKVDGIVDEMRRLQGIPPVEWDYEPND